MNVIKNKHLVNLLIVLATGLQRKMDALIGTLLQSCAEGNPEVLASCLQYGLDLNFVTEDGLTPLMYAVTYAGNCKACMQGPLYYNKFLTLMQVIHRKVTTIGLYTCC